MGIELIVLAGAGFVVGFCAALLGVGGGILMVPLMVLVLDRTQHVAVGTSLLVIAPTALVGVLTHRRAATTLFRDAAILASGGVCGAFGAALIALRLPPTALRFAFAVVLAVSGARLLRDGTRIRSSGATGDHDVG